ncbi:hypothetical protein KZ483_10980 [Paenibacillus sp. sptzw28]|uniref:DUF2642 domain-containing protein n=1 Tax=Paenibacillus sp. sptzw28 TaxID=715179 RepID=UPI001C6F30EB|nr:hypothetical protein [Paenibacillus sp. sptzw28]QYR23386.1 hypothetical protein KZ483_10980 [Paenibacillus sp. sptzw28]
MKLIKPYFGNFVEIEVISDKKISGLLIDSGPDYIVMNKENKYYYLPVNHVVLIESTREPQYSVSVSPDWKADGKPFKTLLQLAKNGLIELYVTGHLPLYGQIVDVMDDYIVFNAVRHGISYIPIFHIKWVSPAFDSGFMPDKKPAPEASAPFKATWREQLETCLGHIVVIDLGLRQNQSGCLKTIENNMVEIVTPDNISRCWNITHIKSIHFP